MRRALGVLGAFTALGLAQGLSLGLPRVGLAGVAPLSSVVLEQVVSAWAFAALFPLFLRLERNSAGLPALGLGVVAITLVHEGLCLPIVVALRPAGLTAASLLTFAKEQGPVRLAVGLGVAIGIAAVLRALSEGERARQTADEALRLEGELSRMALAGATARLSPDEFFERLDGVLAVVRSSPEEAEERVVELADSLRALRTGDGENG